jgi:hypothetical protein
MVGRPPPRGEARTPRQRRRTLLATGGVVLAVAAGLGGFVATHTDSYDRSGGGCITVTVPSTTGGALLHACGSRARAWCAAELSRPDQLAALVRPQCRIAGLAGAASGAGSGAASGAGAGPGQ